jgi:glyoxylate/hydroxypyruvate reductase A
MTASRRCVEVLVALRLEPHQVSRIEAVSPRLRVAYQPELLPSPNAGFGVAPPADPHSEVARRWERLLAEAEVMLGFDWLEPGRLLQRAPRLRWVQADSAGIGEFVSAHQLIDPRLMLTTACGIHGQPIAESVLAGLLHFAKRIDDLQRWKAAGEWHPYVGKELLESEVLIIGLGAIGRRVAELCAAIGMRVTGLRRTSGPMPPGVSRLLSATALDARLGDFPFVVLAAPLTPRTHHLLDRDRINRLRRGAVVINVGRGALIDEKALADALNREALGGAFLDVFEEEPLPAHSPLWTLPNVLISPHSSGAVLEEPARIVDVFIDNLNRYLTGRPLRNLFRAERGY